MRTKDILLAPLYLYQGRKLKRTAIRLPEADGARHGIVSLSENDTPSESPATYPLSIPLGSSLGSPLDSSSQVLNLMLVGDSAAAGVGVTSQKEAVMGHLLKTLSDAKQIKNNYTHIQWALHATSGHTSSDLLTRLYVLPAAVDPVDVMIVIIGANDATSNVTPEQWHTQIEALIAIGKRKFKAKQIVFSCLPPMANFPAIRFPLNRYIGELSEALNARLEQVCHTHNDVSYLNINFADIGLDAKEMFAEDGFHPNSTAYSYWAKQLGTSLIAILE